MLAGSYLRDDIAQLLRLKFYDVTVEKRLAATTADVFYVDDTNPLIPRKIAIEAKDWSKSLTSSEIAAIWNLYASSISNREIDILIIVGRHVLASSPRQTISNLQSVVYVTFDEFQSNMMNFKAVLVENALAFRNHPSSKNFLHSKIAGSETSLLEYTTHWLKTPARGLVIYGGYGIGKTSFSLYLASVISEEYSKGISGRIPIRVSLGGLFTKQDLSGLVCSTLSGADGGAAVKDFSYNMFLEMNRIGKFLLIFDGFDEMRPRDGTR